MESNSLLLESAEKVGTGAIAWLRGSEEFSPIMTGKTALHFSQEGCQKFLKLHTAGWPPTEHPCVATEDKPDSSAAP